MDEITTHTYSTFLHQGCALRAIWGSVPQKNSQYWVKRKKNPLKYSMFPLHHCATFPIKPWLFIQGSELLGQICLEFLAYTDFWVRKEKGLAWKVTWLILLVVQSKSNIKIKKGYIIDTRSFTCVQGRHFLIEMSLGYVLGVYAHSEGTAQAVSYLCNCNSFLTERGLPHASTSVVYVLYPSVYKAVAN